MKEDSDFSVLYYPFCKCYNETVLKRMLLFYDRIYFMDPFNSEEREHFLETSHYFYGIPNRKLNSWKNVNREVYYLLEDEKIVVNLDIYEAIQKYGRQITENVIADISDDLFCQISENQGYSTIWHILERRMPNALLAHLNEVDWYSFRLQTDFAEFSEYLRSFDKDADDFKGYSSEFLAEREKIISNESLYLSRHPKGRVYINASRVPKYEAKHDSDRTLPLDKGYILPYAIGASLSISQAMLVAALNNLNLFTDSEVMNSLLIRKVQIAFGKMRDTLKYKEYTRLKKGLTQNEIFVQTIDSMIPDVYFEKLDFLDMIKLRNACASQLKKFRYYLKSIDETERNPWEPEYWNEIKTIADKLTYEANMLRYQICKVYSDLFRESIKLTASVGLGIAIMPLNLTLGGVLALLVSKEPLDTIWDSWRKTVEHNQNSLVYLLKVQKSIEETS